MRSMRTPGGRIFEVDLGHLLLDPANRRQALFATAHNDDALHDIIIIILPGNAQPGLVTDAYRSDVINSYGHAIDRRDHRVAYLIHRVDQPNAPNDGSLRPEIDRLAPDIDVAVVEYL